MRTRHAILIPLMVVGVVVFLPIIVPIAIAGNAINNRRKRAAAASFACMTCGRLLGDESIRLADDEFRRHMAELRRSRPFVKFRVVQTCHATCAWCGARYTFREKERTFVPEAAGRSGVPNL